MIRHICMFKLKDENKEANLKEALRRLEEMREIPLIATFEVVTNAAAAPDSNYDLSLIFEMCIRDRSSTVMELSGLIVTSIFLQYPARASSTALSTISYTR